MSVIHDQAAINDWYVVAHAADVVRGRLSPVKLLEQELVLWRSEAALHAWRDQCPHRGTRLSLGSLNAEDKLACAYHGWEFDNQGTCVRVPAHPHQTPSSKARVASYKVQERYELVWVSLGEPDHGVPTMPETNDPDYKFYFGGSYLYRSSAQRAIENFLDLAHFPYVHGGVLGDPGRAEVKHYDVEVTADGILARNCLFWQPDPGNTAASEGAEVDYTYWVPRPLTAYLSKDVGARRADGKRATEAIILSMQPLDETTSVGWTLVATNYDEQIPASEVATRTKVIIDQDVAIVDNQLPKRLPLELSEEFHHHCDQSSLVYRRWLKELGLTYGTTAYKSD